MTLGAQRSPLDLPIDSSISFTAGNNSSIPTKGYPDMAQFRYGRFQWSGAPGGTTAGDS
uniref:Uncharacterized protein n=2 Tax=Bacteria TaxID=2 RepID=E7C4I2_9BACT|nr:hypothetical protein [uncultured Gemmatimonadales bacterium HF0200_36I24]ADI22356.1 hypothetical protein [uncultured nuHF2 cluster bacterium HF0500_02A10]